MSSVCTSFIPDDVVFDEEPKEVATEVELSTYTPKLFTSSAAATSKVHTLAHAHAHMPTHARTHIARCLKWRCSCDRWR